MPANNVGVNSTFEQQRLVINEIAVDVDLIKTTVGTAGTIITTTVDGNVGIGTTTSLTKVTVLGDTKVGFNTSQGVILTSPNGTEYRLIVDDSGILGTVPV